MTSCTHRHRHIGKYVTSLLMNHPHVARNDKQRCSTPPFSRLTATGVFFLCVCDTLVRTVEQVVGSFIVTTQCTLVCNCPPLALKNSASRRQITRPTEPRRVIHLCDENKSVCALFGQLPSSFNHVRLPTTHCPLVRSHPS